MADHYGKLITGLLESPIFQRSIIGLIIVNSIIIGLETSPTLMASYGGPLMMVDRLILGLFLLEVVLNLSVYRLSYFKSGWNVFDFVIVSIAILPTSGAFSILRAFRIFRSLRLIKTIPKLRFIVEALLHSLPSLIWIFVLLSLVFYVFAVVGTTAFGADFPHWFGTLGASMFTLFQIMTLEGWAEISRTIQEAQPFAMFYFISFILIASYTTLNIFIAIVVNTMSEIRDHDRTEEIQAIEQIVKEDRKELSRDIAYLKEFIARLEKRVGQP